MKSAFRRFSARSGTSITAKCNTGGLSGSGWYLFVIDASGNVSSGYLVN